MKVLDAARSADLAGKHVSIARHVVARRVDDAAAFAKKEGYPVVLKLLSPKVVHKTEFGAVQKVRDERDLREKFVGLIARAKQKRLPVSGVLVQEFVQGTELIIGAKKDVTFGYGVLVGIGGIAVEVYRDVAFRVCPVERNDVEEMLDELRGKKLLEGFRGAAPVSKKAIVDAVLGVCRLVQKNPKITELDINPFIANARKGVAVDVRIVVE